LDVVVSAITKCRFSKFEECEETIKKLIDKCVA